MRLLLLALSENQLDADESLIGLMGIDILEGRSLPFFVYRTTYDGGGAFEAYLCALGFALAGITPVVPKLVVLLVWALTAAAFQAVCRNHLPPYRAFLATLLFCVGTPFFLEWSLKARGGYQETMLVSILLLLLPDWQRLSGRPRLLGAVFGLTVGVALWLSEMILPLLPGAVLWLAARRPKAEYRDLLLGSLAGSAIGAAPLLAYNLTHDWAHVRTSVVARLLGTSSVPLTLSEVGRSLRFVLGPGHAIAIGAGLVGAYRLARNGLQERRLRLEHVFLLGLSLYLLGFVLSGLRYLHIPPSRVLYQLAPAVAVLLAVCFDVQATRRPVRWGAASVLTLWLLSVAVPATQWAASGRPREAGSWRGSWSLIDASSLEDELVDRGVRLAFTSYWTLWQLRFELARTQGPRARPRLQVSDALPPRPLPAGREVGFVLQTGTPALAWVEKALVAGAIAHEREEWQGYVILSAIESSAVHVGAGFPPALVRLALPEPSAEPDGFN